MTWFTFISKWQIIREDLISRNFAYAKFRETKTLGTISQFTVPIVLMDP